MQQVSPQAAMSLLSSPWAAEEAPTGALAVTFDTLPDDWPITLPALPCVTIAVVRAPDIPPGVLMSFDVVVAEARDHAGGWVAPPGGVDDSVFLLGQMIDAHPEAAVVTAQVLRATEGATTSVGLTVESLAYSLLQTGSEFAAWMANRAARTHHEGADPPVLIDRDGPSLILTLNRPDVANAFDRAMRDELVEGLRTAATDASIVEVVLRGNGLSFCSGGDLSEFGSSPDPLIAHRVRATRSAGFWAASVGERMRAELHGACVGAGVELAAWAHSVVADPDAYFLLPEVGMGLLPGAGGTASIPRRIGRQRTTYLALSCRPIDALTALAWGLVDQVKT